MNDSERLPFFPVPAEGETLYSVVSRCSERLGIANRYLLSWLTRQTRTTTLFAVLPGYLATFSRVMPNGHPLQNTDVLIRKHTALPYFTYFHNNAQRQETYSLLDSPTYSQPIALRLGLSSYKTSAYPKHPRFCVTCLQEQSSTLGFSYFQLAHQLPGVTHCWCHEEILSDGCTSCGTYPLNGRKLTIPGQCLCNAFKANQLQEPDPDSEPEVWFARQSAYLLLPNNNQDDRRQRLRESIIGAGISRGSLVDYALLGEVINTRFGTAFLTHINHPVWDQNGKPSAWLRRCIPKEGHDKKRLSTIVGLLVLGAVFDSVKTFEEAGQPALWYHEIDPTYPKSNSNLAKETAETIKPTVIATNSKESLNTKGWEIRLANLLKEHQYRISACAISLGCSSWTIAKAARQQGLSVPLTSQSRRRIGEARLNGIRLQLQRGVEKKQILSMYAISEWSLLLIELDDPGLSARHRDSAASNRREKHRTRVIDFLQRNPCATRQTVLTELSGAYDYLLRRDGDWFRNNVPKALTRKKVARPTRVDWQEVDTLLAKEILATGRHIFTSDARPRRITTTGLLKQHQALQKFMAQPSRFPHTQEAISSLIESKEQFFERKVRWGISRIMASNRKISMDSLRREVAMSSTLLKRNLEIVHIILNELGTLVSEKSILSRRSQ